MFTLQADDIVSIWDAGQNRRWPGRADLLLALARPDLSADERRRLSVGRRDAVLLAFRGRCLGPRLDVLTDCPACGEALDLVLSTDELAAAMDFGASPFEAGGIIECDGLRLAWRVPTSGDVLALEATETTEEFRGGLLARCVEARREDTPIDVGQLPEEAIAELARALERADPGANVELGMACPACGHGFAALFDVVRYLWSEFGDLARGLIGQVHRLARAYGWSESEILAMSHARRQAYLSLIP